MIDAKLKKGSFTGQIIGWAVAMIICGWTVMYLYFLSSSQVPSSVYDYTSELALKENALQRTLIRISSLNPHSSDLIRIYQMLSDNEICLGDFQAAEKSMVAALSQAQSKVAPNSQNMAEIYLESANLSRDMNKFELAKVNYENSINSLQQIDTSPQFNVVDFNNIAVNFNNLGVLYFLMSEKAINVKERQKYLLAARDYFARAKHLISIIGSSKNQCFQESIDKNLNQCLSEMQFLR